MNGRISVRTAQLVIAFSVILIWVLVTELRWVSPIVLTPLSKTITTMVDQFLSGKIYKHLKITLIEFGAAYAIAVGFGLLTGFIVGMVRFLREVYEPVLLSLYAIPIIILYPIILIILGFGIESKIAFAAIIGFFPIALNAITGVKSVDQKFIEAAKTMGATKAEIIVKVVIPGSLPIIFTGLRLGMNSTMIGVIAGEMIASIEGMGYKIAESGTVLDMSALYSFILVTLGVITILNQGVGRLEKLIGAWRE